MSIEENYINVLSLNASKLNNTSVLSLILNAISSKHICKVQRENFILSKQKGSDEAEKHATSYLDCHNRVISSSNTACADKLKSGVDCLSKFSKLDTIPIDCVSHIEDLIQCSQRF